MAKIDTNQIKGYAEMSLEDKLKALEAFEYNDNASELEKQKRQFQGEFRSRRVEKETQCPAKRGRTEEAEAGGGHCRHAEGT